MSDKKRKTIGIIGGYGVIGIDVCRWLLQTTPHTIILGGRDKEKGMRAAAGFDNVRFMAADVEDPVSLDAFCSECDLVVNCTGPSRILGDGVASVALEKGIDYVDPSGGESLYNNVYAKHRKKILEKGLCFILSAGVFPGLSELLPDYIIKTGFDRVDRVTYHYCAYGDLSWASAWDFVCTLEENVGEGWICLRDGKKEKETQARMVPLPPPVGRIEMIPLLTEGLIRVGGYNNVTTIYEYHSVGKNLLASMLSIVGEERYRTADEKRQSANELIKGADADLGTMAEALQYCVMIHMEMDGVLDGNRQKTVTTAYHPSGYPMTAMTVADTARLVADGAVAGPGLHHFENGVDQSKFMDLFRKQEGLVYTHSVSGEL